VGDRDNGWTGRAGDWVEYGFDQTRALTELRLVFDSGLNNDGNFNLKMPCYYPLNAPPKVVPPTLIRAFRVEGHGGDGAWAPLTQVRDNCQRLVRIGTTARVAAVRFIPEQTWGADTFHVFAWDVS
jgi:hypothetical protein